MRLSTEASVTIPRPQSEVFDHLVQDEALVRYCRSWGPFAAIDEARTEGARREGATRHVRMSDGMALEETITEWVEPARHGYRWGPPPKPLGLLIRQADGLFLFEEAGPGQTKVTWRYTFTFRSPVLWPVGKGLLAGFRRWMQAGLDNAQTAL